MEVLRSAQQHRGAGRFWGARACRWFVLICCLMGLTGWGGGGAVFAEEISREYQLKAALLYNLTRFVEWPSQAFDSPESPFVVCVLGPDPFGTVLDEIVRAERSNNRPIVVRRISRIAEADGAQVVFISPSRRKEAAETLQRFRGRPVLTVGDFDGFLRSGGTVRMQSTPDRKIKLRVNLDSAKLNGLTMSAKLLRVCTIVQTGDE